MDWKYSLPPLDTVRRAWGFVCPARCNFTEEAMISPMRVAPAIMEMIRMRNKAFRRHQTDAHMWRRLKEDRNEHYNDLTCPCWTDKKAMARFKEQPQHCSWGCCGNQRHAWGKEDHTMQERRFFCKSESDWG